MGTPPKHTGVPQVGIARLPWSSYPAGPETDNPVSQALSRLADALRWFDEKGPASSLSSVSQWDA